MDLLDYLSVFRRRWTVIAATVVVALFAAWFTTETFAPVAPTKAEYAASTVLVSDGTAIGDISGNLSALAAITRFPQVVNRAAKDLGTKGNPLALRERISATPDTETGFLTLTASARRPEEAKGIADAFAKALIDFLRDHRERVHSSDVAVQERRIREARLAGDEAALFAAQQQLALLEAEATSPGVAVIHRAVAEEVSPSEFAPPDSRLARLAIALVIGLLAGAGLVLVLERVDTRIRTSEQASERFGYPVIAEIPTFRRDLRKGIVTADHPTSPSADAFRLLGAGVHVALRSGSEDDAADRGRVVLVTSAGPAEGKSTIVVNLAAVLAEEGKRVIVFSTDLRRPTLHQVLGADPRPGLVQAARDREHGLRRFKQSTGLHRVSFVASGGPADRPGEVLGSPTVSELLREASAEAEWVLLDTAPILVAGESASLLDHADLVLVVARSGSISIPMAERTRDILHRLGVDAAWVVLNDCREKDVPAAYRRYHVSVEKDALDLSQIPSTTKGFPR